MALKAFSRARSLSLETRDTFFKHTFDDTKVLQPFFGKASCKVEVEVRHMNAFSVVLGEAHIYRTSSINCLALPV